VIRGQHRAEETPVGEQLLGGSQRAIWNGLGEAWVRHAELHDRQAEPFGLAVLDALGDLAGARVLDVGCGTGATAAQLLERGAGQVLGVDLSEPMVAAARTWIDDPRVRVELGDVLELAPGEGFDAVFSRFGVMFFSDPVAAFRRLRSYGAPGAALGFCSWGPPFDNPVMTLPVMASAPVLGAPQLPGPGEPGPFSLSEPAAVVSVLEAAGWTEVKVTELVLEPPHPAGGAEAVAAVVMEFNPMLVDGLRRHPDLYEAAQAAIVEGLRPFERGGIVHLGAHALIVTARS
jgi:SAM-dependent methyltransferase